jgi:hypothetical protein
MTAICFFITKSYANSLQYNYQCTVNNSYTLIDIHGIWTLPVSFPIVRYRVPIHNRSIKALLDEGLMPLEEDKAAANKNLFQFLSEYARSP